MTVVGLDDTDSRERGMCTTYLAARLADQFETVASVERVLLIRLHPAIEHKTRGNAALAIHTDLDPDTAFDLACEELTAAETGDPDTHPGVVIAAGDPDEIPGEVVTFARDAMRQRHELDDALALIDAHDYRAAGWKRGRGRIGALAAVGSWPVLVDHLDDFTYEHITYRSPERWGTDRDIDSESVFTAAEAGYPTVWDTVDTVEDDAVCVPHTPGPVLYGIRGDDPDAVRAVAATIDSEPIDRERTFVTNQGTDAHLREGTIGELISGRCYRVTGTVVDEPETQEGGHVFFTLGTDGDTVGCAAFEPTKRFRDRIRALRAGDRITACGEYSAGTIKLEKVAVRSLVQTRHVTPTCPDCGRTMESAGAGQGYRCRDCGTHRETRVECELERAIDPGWYEVPPCARRHIASPLVRGGFDGHTHPER